MKAKQPGPRSSRFAYHRARIKQFKKHPFAVPVATFLALFFLSVIGLIGLGGSTIGANDAHVIIATHDGKTQTIPTRAATVGEFLNRAAIEIHEGDRVEPALETPIIDDNFRVNVYRARPVIVIDGGRKIQALSAATTPRSTAEQVGVKVYPEDGIKSQPTENILRDGIGEQVVIDRATPANLNLYGTQVVVRTRAKSVGELLKEKQVALSQGDSVQPAQETPLTPNIQVFVLRTGTQITTVAEDIPMPVQYIEDSSLTFGASAVRQKGSPGKKLVTYQLDLVNSKEVGRHVIQQVIQSEPVTQIVARGRAIDIARDKESVMAAAGISSSDYGYVNYIISRESGWCPTKLQGHHDCPPYAPAYIPSGYGYGLPQATPGSKMSTAGADWQTNPVTQLRWSSGYAQKYGGWAGAYNFWQAHHYW